MLGILLVAAAAFAILSLSVFPSGDLLLGGFAVLLAARTQGLRYGILTALVCGCYMLACLQDPFPLILLATEALIAGLLFQRGMRSIPIADSIFWIFFGLPLAWLHYALFKGFHGDELIKMLQQWLCIGLGNALLAFLLFTFLPFERWRSRSPIAYWESQFNLLTTAFLLPSLLLALGYAGQGIIGWPVLSFVSRSQMILFSLAVFLAPGIMALGLIRVSNRRLMTPLHELASATRDLPKAIASDGRIAWPRSAAFEVHSLIENVRRIGEEWEHCHRELEETREKAGQTVDDLLAQRNWEFFATDRKLRSEIDRRHRIEELHSQLESAESKYRFLVEKTLVGVYIIQGGKLSYVNPKFADIFGYAGDELLPDRSFLDLIDQEDRVLVAGHLRRQDLGEVNNLQYQFRGVRKDGRIIHVEVLNGKGAYNGGTAIIGTLMDISDRVQAQKTIQHMAYHDPLTELPNRLLFGDRVQQALTYAERNELPLALLFLDLDRFKNINDTLGHAAGDQLLRDVAARLRDCLRDSDTIGRFGGDEFNILATRIRKPSDADLVAHKILRAMKFPFEIEGHEVFVTCSIGVAIYPQDCQDLQNLMKYADAALYRAKDLGRNNYQTFSPSMTARSLERMTMETSLRRALERREMRVHYQPQINLQSGLIIGMEALVRWERPVGEMIPPQAFIPLAEELGIIVPIGEWVLRTACNQAKTWQQKGLENLRVGVNVSPLQFQESNFIEVVSRIVDESGIDPRWINLEITESVMIKGAREAITKFCQLHDVGLTVAIDDFGIGYSSLSYLRDFPVDQLKLDRAFVRNLPHDPNDVGIARHIVEMAHGVGLKVIAEGVETEEQYVFLRRIGCDEVQGYLLGYPMAPEDFAAMLRWGEPSSFHEMAVAAGSTSNAS